ncbi:uncharacterized protein [Littorina saxatilis]|uniref:MADF domain-containing protein n=1 Tax=Littorina saxatilis TaxID=31220 RepID=A0AAN9AIP7_9CAEN
MKGKHISVEDITLFIERVRINPSLYNTTDIDYKDQTKVFNTWENIAKTMGLREMKGVDWKKRWRNMRDVYVKKRRTIRTTKNPLTMERAKSWRYLHLMTFLEGQIDDGGSTDDFGPAVDSDNAELSNAEGEVYGEDDSASCSEKPVVVSLDMSCEPEMNPFTATPAAPSLASSTLHSNDTSKRVTSSISRGQKRTLDGGYDHETESPFAEIVKNHKSFRDDIHSPPRSAEHVFFDSYALRMANLPHETRSYLQLQISQLFFNAENPGRPPVPVISLPQHEAAHTQRTPSYLNSKSERDADLN